MIAIELVAAVSLAFWIALRLDRSRRWPPVGSARLAGDERPDEPRVAIVPARDEADSLPRTLPALLRQLSPWAQVVVVDDGSSDGTGRVARRVAREAGAEGRVRVVVAPPAPDGWTGKVHAMACGLKAVPADQSPWILFVDADIELSGGVIASLMRRARNEGGDGELDLVSVMARLEARGFWQGLLVPPFVFFFHLLYPFARVCDPSSRVAAAAGGCLLIRRASLDWAGGLESLRVAVIDDVALAKAIKAAGGGLWLGLDSRVVSTRRYRGLSAIWKMVARSAFTQLRHSPELLLTALAGLTLFFVVPLLGILVAPEAWRQIEAGVPGGAVRTVAWCLLSWLLGAAALVPAVRYVGARRLAAFGLPLAAVLYGAMTVTSAWDHFRGGTTEWKGRSYPA